MSVYEDLIALQGKDDAKGICRYGLVVLNTPLGPLLPFLKNIWKRCSENGITICADGGANRLHDALEEYERELYIPDLICGDLDSARDEVLQYYKSKGSQIVCLEDQSYTDFTKAVMYLHKQEKGTHLKLTGLIAFNAFMGRIDQIFGCLNSLYEAAKYTNPSLPVYLMTEESLTWLLLPGEHVISTTSGVEEGHCGLIPLGEPVSSVTTTGLVWNLNSDRLSFGHLISVCNLLDHTADKVTVVTSHPLIWTMEHNLNILLISQQI